MEPMAVSSTVTQSTSADSPVSKLKIPFSDLIGKPFCYGGRGPDKFDCYGLVREMYQRKGIEIPDAPSSEKAQNNQSVLTINRYQHWKDTKEQPYVAVLFQIRGFVCHVAFTLPDGKFIHTWESSGGIVIERLQLWRNRIAGFVDYNGA
jgi:cell wall-associated NlpC family hydrolase